MKLCKWFVYGLWHPSSQAQLQYGVHEIWSFQQPHASVLTVTFLFPHLTLALNQIDKFRMAWIISCSDWNSKTDLLSHQNRVVPVGWLLPTTRLVNGSGARDCANRNNLCAGSLFWFGFWYITWTFAIDVPEDWPYKAMKIKFLNSISSACDTATSWSASCKPTNILAEGIFKALI